MNLSRFVKSLHNTESKTSYGKYSMVKQKFLTILLFSEFFLWDVKRLNNLKNLKNGIFLKYILNFYKVL